MQTQRGVQEDSDQFMWSSALYCRFEHMVITFRFCQFALTLISCCVRGCWFMFVGLCAYM